MKNKSKTIFKIFISKTKTNALSKKSICDVLKISAYIVVVMATLSCLFACSKKFSFAKNPASKGSIKIATWNVQTFFDAINDGIEYSEFKKSKNWTQSAYEARLSKLCDGLKKLDAEVYVLEEIENERIIYDITNKLAGDAWYKNKKLNYAVFAKDEGISIGCAVLSRLPLSDATVHSLDVRTEKDKQPAMRPLIKVTITKNDRELTLFVNHWKSKSGGTEKTEVWRNWQESLLAKSVLQMGNRTAISCGDFNRDICDFAVLETTSKEDNFDGEEKFVPAKTSNRSEEYSALANRKNVLLRTSFFGKLQTVAAYSPWLDEKASLECGSEGSYYFHEKWERIDHFFSTGNAIISDFAVATETPFAQADGTPDRYTLYNGRGCSDHLPLLCTVSY